MNERSQAISAGISNVLTGTSREWKQRYLDLAEEFLEEHIKFEGGQLCEYCRKHGLPDPHHHNVWAAMLTMLHGMGWIVPLAYITPTTTHSRIDKLRLWFSKLYDYPNKKESEDPRLWKRAS